MFGSPPDNPDEIFIKELVAGGCAAREGTVQLGDILISIDGKEVNAKKLNDMRSWILGEVGTFVSLRLIRRSPDGLELDYTISLMRAHNQFFEQLKQKSRMQQEADILRQNMRVVEDEREQLRNMLAEAEAKSSGEKVQLDELMRGLEVAQETLWNNQQTLTREQEERMKLENLLGSIRDQKDQDTRNLEQLRGWLDQAQEKLSGAHESLKVTRQNKTDMESRYKEEKEMRSECEDLERQLIEQMEAKMEEDRKFREEREQELLSLEEERRKYEKMLRQLESDTDDEIRKRKVMEARIEKVDQQHDKIAEDNARLVMMLKEAEDARETIQQAKADTEAKNFKIEEELLSIDEQSAKRQLYIEDLKQKLESERQRLETELRKEQENRKQDATTFKKKEEDMLVQISKASEDVRLTKDDHEDKHRKFETNISRLEQEVKSLEAAFKAEESLTDALHERCTVLSEQLVVIEDELKGYNEELVTLQERQQQAEADKLRVLEKERAMAAELQKEIDSEPEKINAIENMKRRLEEERRGALLFCVDALCFLSFHVANTLADAINKKSVQTKKGNCTRLKHTSARRPWKKTSANIVCSATVTTDNSWLTTSDGASSVKCSLRRRTKTVWKNMMLPSNPRFPPIRLRHAFCC